MLEQLLLVSTAVLGVAFVRSLRRAEAQGWAHTLVLAAVLLVSLGAIVGGSGFWAVVAVCLTALVVVTPFVLEAGARTMFARGRLRLAVRLAGLRSTLMLGAGLARQQQILTGLAILEHEGADAALEHFSALASDTEDEGELALINEQIVSMFFYAQRWAEGIAHYEARFHPRYGALRPALALGLLRAYGESEQLEPAAVLLQALEQGPVGTDPRALGLVSQARLTFLAYAGVAAPVAQALEGPGRKALGLSKASGALFRGIALARSGERAQAQAELGQVEPLAHASDDRVVDAARRAMAHLQGLGAQLEPVEVAQNLEGYVADVVTRLEGFVAVAPSLRKTESPLVSFGLVLVSVAGYIAALFLGAGIGVLQAGAATPELLAAGQWYRLLTAGLVQGDPMATLLNIYTLWLAAPVVERVFGGPRLLLIALAAAAFGVVAGAAGGMGPGEVLAGGNLMALGVGATALWITLPKAGAAGLSPTARRRLAVPLALVLVAQLTSMMPGVLAVSLPWAGALGAVCVGIIGALAPAALGRRLVAVLAGIAALGVVVAVVLVGLHPAGEYLAAHRTQTLDLKHVKLHVPSSFERVEAPLKLSALHVRVQAGAVDAVALRGGVLVEFVGVAPLSASDEGRSDDGPSEQPGLLRVDPTLDREVRVTPAEVPAPFAAAYAVAGGEAEVSAFTLRRNGATVAIVLERPLPSGASVVLIASPADALNGQVGLYAAVLADAESAPLEPPAAQQR